MAAPAPSPLSGPNAERRGREDDLLSLAPLLAAATTLPAILDTAATWPAAFGAAGVALYLAPVTRGGDDPPTRAYAAGLTPTDLTALDAALATNAQLSETDRPADGEGIGPAALPLVSVLAEPAWLLPLRVAEGSVGALVLTNPTPLRRADHDRWSSGAAQLAAALARARLLAMEHQRARTAWTLTEIGQTFAHLSTDDALTRLAELCGDALGDGCWIALRDDDDPAAPARVVGVYHRVPEKRRVLATLLGTVVRPGEGMAGRILATGEALVGPSPTAGDVAPEPRAMVAALGVHSRLGVPLCVTDAAPISGLLLCQASESETILSEDDLPLARQLALAVATAVENARHHEAARRHKREAALLAETDRLFGPELTPDEILPRIVELAVAALGDVALLHLWENDRADPLPVAASATPALEARWREVIARAARVRREPERGAPGGRGAADRRHDDRGRRSARLGWPARPPLLARHPTPGPRWAGRDPEHRRLRGRLGSRPRYDHTTPGRGVRPPRRHRTRTRAPGRAGPAP